MMSQWTNYDFGSKRPKKKTDCFVLRPHRLVSIHRPWHPLTDVGGYCDRIHLRRQQHCCNLPMLCHGHACTAATQSHPQQSLACELPMAMLALTRAILLTYALSQ
jgi:hypothetical protein